MHGNNKHPDWWNYIVTFIILRVISTDEIFKVVHLGCLEAGVNVSATVQRDCFSIIDVSCSATKSLTKVLAGLYVPEPRGVSLGDKDTRTPPNPTLLSPAKSTLSYLHCCHSRLLRASFVCALVAACSLERSTEVKQRAQSRPPPLASSTQTSRSGECVHHDTHIVLREVKTSYL